jgi:hypothetical protein
MQLNWIWIELKFLSWIEILKLKWIKLNTIFSSFGCNKVNVPTEISIELNLVELNHIKSNWIQIGWIQPNYIQIKKTCIDLPFHIHVGVVVVHYQIGTQCTWQHFKKLTYNLQESKFKAKANNTCFSCVVSNLKTWKMETPHAQCEDKTHKHERARTPFTPHNSK